MSSILIDSKTQQFTERIYDNFCIDCANQRKCHGEGLQFVPGDGVCVRFDWKSADRKKQYEESVLDAQATTLWLEKGKTLSAINSMSKTARRSILSDNHFKQFDIAEARRKDLLAKVLGTAVEETPISSAPQIHYFNCLTAEGKKIIYKRNTTSKSYKAELPAFRRYLEKQNIKILKEEIK